jgi:hypothetical protein
MVSGWRLALVLCLTGAVALLILLPRHAEDAGSLAPPDAPVVDYPFIAPRGYVCCRAQGPLKIDGLLDETAWSQAAWSEPFLDIEGERKPPPRHRTRVKMLWDDEALYIGAWLDEPHVWATLTQHDSVIFKDNDFEVFLDPDGDSHLYGELELNALNTTWDLLLPKPYKNGGKAIDAWEITGLRTAVHVDGTINDPRDIDRGWSVEIAWPWKSLGELMAGTVPPRHGEQWRINFSRVEWQHEVVGSSYRKVAGQAEDNWVWSPQGAIDMHRPERWGYLQFSTAPPGTAAFVRDPGEQARHLLHQVCYAQQAYKKAHGHWARSLGTLGLARQAGAPPGAVHLESTETSYEASVAERPGAKTGRRWHIAADAHIWVK